MSGIAYVCKCFFNSPLYISRDLDFEREHYVIINEAENCMYWAHAEVFDNRILDDYLALLMIIVSCMMENIFFISCSKCLVEIKSKVSQVKRFEDGRHEECFNQFESFLDERLSCEIRGEYIYHIRGLRKDCVFEWHMHANVYRDFVTIILIFIRKCI